MRSGSDQRHIALDDIDELRNFIKTGLAQDSADWRNPGIALHRLAYARGVARIDAHRTELIDFEEPVPIAVSVLIEQHRPPGRDLDRDSDRYQERREEQQGCTRERNVEKSLSE